MVFQGLVFLGFSTDMSDVVYHDDILNMQS